MSSISMCTGTDFSIVPGPRMMFIRRPYMYEWRIVLSPEIGTNKRLFPLFWGRPHGWDRSRLFSCPAKNIWPEYIKKPLAFLMEASGFTSMIFY